MTALLLVGLGVGGRAVVPAAAQEGPPTAQPSALPSDTSTVADPYLSFRVREWTLNDGLPEPLKEVAQTPDGYLWITTFDGLVRFDGVRFTRYTTGTTPVFRSHNLLGLYVAHDGALWAGGRDGWVYRLRGGTWTAFDLRDILSGHWVQGFAEDATGALWMGSTGPIAARFDGSTWARVQQPIRDVWPPLVADANGTIWTLLAATDAPGHPETLIGDGVVARWDGQRFVPVPDERWQGFVATQHGPLFHRVEDPTILRPPFVHGPRQPYCREVLFWDRMLDDRPVILPDGGTAPMQWGFAPDVAEACVQILEVRETAAIEATAPLSASVENVWGALSSGPDW